MRLASKAPFGTVAVVLRLPNARIVAAAAAITSTAAPAINANRFRFRLLERASARAFAATPVGPALSASENSLAVSQRSAGDLASERATADSSHSGTPSRVSLSRGADAANRREMITCAVGPTNG